jgi:transcriptional regulator of acetoin/glycerol metabolism
MFLVSRTLGVDRGVTTATDQPLGEGDAGHSRLLLRWVFPEDRLPIARLDADGPDELVIGRDEDSAICLPSSQVSRRHAALRRRSGSVERELVDLGSRNGTRRNGVAVECAELAHGDVVRLGAFVGVVSSEIGDFSEILPDLWGGGLLARSVSPLLTASASDLPIVLEGETGTGKEVVARGVHRLSGRPGAFVAVNCAALPAELAEAELFGYRRGAFTGAERPSPGFFRAADGGTLLLDEVSDLPLALQAKLLRVLEQREVQPLGEPRPVPVDVRVIVAGQESLLAAARERRFRPDLLARLDGVNVRLPSLRDRREDVWPLFRRLLERTWVGAVPAFETDLAERLVIHDFPFNVREIVLLVRRLLVLHGSATSLGARHLPPGIGERAPEAVVGASPSPAFGSSPVSSPVSSLSNSRPRREPVALESLVAALRASSGNVAQASAILGITRQRAYRLMEGHGLDLESFREPSGESS